MTILAIFLFMNDCLRIKKLNVVLLVLISFGLLLSCSSERLDIDVSDIDVKIQIKRFEKDLFTLNPDSIWESTSFFTGKYGLFYELFNKKIINIGGIEHPSYNNNLRGFITDPDMTSVYEDCIDQYTNIEYLANNLTIRFYDRVIRSPP